MIYERPNTWKPDFVREIHDHASEVGMLRATHELLERNNVVVATVGETDRIREHTGGLLFVGNHNKQFEFAALMAVLGGMGRPRMKNIVKFYVERQVAWAFGDVGTDIVQPVYPRLLATDRRNKLNAELATRILYRKSLLSTAESNRRNEEALEAAAQELTEDGIVNIFPCGSIVNNMKKPWRSGVGRIMQKVPPEARSNVLVVPYHADNIHRIRLLGAVAARGKGPLSRPQQVDVAFGILQTIDEIFGTLPPARRYDPAALTDAVRQQYMRSFLE